MEGAVEMRGPITRRQFLRGTAASSLALGAQILNVPVNWSLCSWFGNGLNSRKLLLLDERA
ncbi:MAG: twin-arginine translocation signal domain-containing protein [Planctomycetota bacterium]|jgi:hypothetical protein